MDYQEYDRLVREELRQYAESEEDNTVTRAAREMLPDLDTGPPYISHPYSMGYSVDDAAWSILLCSDVWDEDWAIRHQDRLNSKYTRKAGK
jgi:hypothetical protein